jgi:hypothetical protein
VTDQNTHSPAAEAKTQATSAVKAAEAAPAKAAEAAKPAKAQTAKAAKPARRTARKAAKAAPAPRKTPQRRSVKTVRAAKQTINHSINEGTRTMKKEANQMADRMQAVFGDYNERAKTAFERNARFTEELTELSKGNVEALVASTKVAARGVETIGQEVAELSRRSFEEASAAMRSFVEVKSPTDLFRLQGEFVRGQFDTFVAESAKMSEAMIKLAGDVAEPLAGRYTVAAEKVKTAVAA